MRGPPSRSGPSAARALLGWLLLLGPAIAHGTAPDAPTEAAQERTREAPGHNTEAAVRAERAAGQERTAEEEALTAEEEAPTAEEEALIAEEDGREPPEEVGLTEEVAREISAEDFTRIFTSAPSPWQPRTGWAYTAYGTAAFLPIAGWVGAGLAAGGRVPFLATGTNALAAGVLGFLPASLGGLYSNPVRGRWRDIDVAVFGLSLLLTPPLAGLGAWSSQALLFGGHQSPGRAYLAATLGALVGHLVGMGLDTLLRDRFPMPELGGYRLLLSVSCVGSGAALGQALFSNPSR